MGVVSSMTPTKTLLLTFLLLGLTHRLAANPKPKMLRIEVEDRVDAHESDYDFDSARANMRAQMCADKRRVEAQGKKSVMGPIKVANCEVRLKTWNDPDSN